MYDGDRRLLDKMAPKLKRVLLADPQTASVRLLRELLRDIADSYVFIAEDEDRALKIAAASDPQLIIVEIGDHRLDGLEVVRRIRKSNWLCRKAPIITVTNIPTEQAILAARDAGAHEFLRKPFSVRDLTRRLQAVTMQERDWVEGIKYIGPDRRRFNSGEYSGPLKRRTDGRDTPHQQRINQALKIVRAAVDAVETDPVQAMRAMVTQATTLLDISTDLKLTVSASEFYRLLTKAAADGIAITRKEAREWSSPLMNFLTSDDEGEGDELDIEAA